MQIAGYFLSIILGAICGGILGGILKIWRKYFIP